MKLHWLILCITIIFFSANSSLDDDIKTLHTELYRNYWSENTTFKFMQTWDHLEGLFQSNIHFNFVDKKNGVRTAALRQRFKIDDENMFVTSFVLYGLLQAEQLGTVEADHHLFSRSLQTLASFRDKNQPFGIPQYTFWPQELLNGTWSSASVNLFALIDQIPNFS